MLDPDLAAPGQSSSHNFSATRPARSHTAHVMRQLGLDIVSGRYKQNAILPGDAELMEQFRVSRTVLREAMKTLAGKGLIKARARIGTRVCPRDEWNLFDPDVLIWHAETGLDASFFAWLGEMRLALEPEAAALAALRHTPEQLAGLFECVDRMGAENYSPADFVAADLSFHLGVASAAANPFLRSISTLIEVALVSSLTISSPADDSSEHLASVAAHRAIADAIAARDPDAARAAMRVVINQGIARTTRARTG